MLTDLIVCVQSTKMHPKSPPMASGSSDMSPTQNLKSVLALPDELLLEVFMPKEPLKPTRRNLLSFAQTCKRVRIVLLPSIYSIIKLGVTSSRSSTLSRLLQFLELAEPYGHLCREITLRIDGHKHGSHDFISVLDALGLACPHFTMLRLFRLNLVIPTKADKERNTDWSTG